MKGGPTRRSRPAGRGVGRRIAARAAPRPGWCSDGASMAANHPGEGHLRLPQGRCTVTCSAARPEAGLSGEHRGRASVHLRDQHLGLARRAEPPRGQDVGLAGVPAAEWDAIAALGFDAVWLMGVWERSPAGIAIALENEGSIESFRARAARRHERRRRRLAVLHPRLHGRRATSAGRRGSPSARTALAKRGARADPRLRPEPRRARPPVDGGAPRVLRPRRATTTSSATRPRSCGSATACSRTAATPSSPPGRTSCS